MQDGLLLWQPMQGFILQATARLLVEEILSVKVVNVFLVAVGRSSAAS